MIALTRLNKATVVINAELLKMIEATPDTLITLVNGSHLMVRESVEEVVAKAIDYARQILQENGARPDSVFVVMTDGMENSGKYSLAEREPNSLKDIRDAGTTWTSNLRGSTFFTLGIGSYVDE